MCNYLQNVVDISFSLVMEFIGWWVLKNNIHKGNIVFFEYNERQFVEKQQKSDFQSEFSMSRIIQIFLLLFF